MGGRIMAPQRHPHSIPWTCEYVMLRGKRVWWTIQVGPMLSQQALKWKSRQKSTSEWRHMRTWLAFVATEDGGRASKPRNMRNLERLEKASKWTLRADRKECQPVRWLFRLWKLSDSWPTNLGYFQALSSY